MWQRVYELDSKRQPIFGTAQDLRRAIAAGADLRIGTAFIHGEHIDPKSPSKEVIEEVADYGVTYMVYLEGSSWAGGIANLRHSGATGAFPGEHSWAAGIMNLRQPVDLPDGFGPRPSISGFMYQENGDQGVARPFLDGKPAVGTVGMSPIPDGSDMPKYHVESSFDEGTNAPCQNFFYAFEYFRFFVEDSWREVYATDEAGASHGSLEELVDAFRRGGEIKVAIGNACTELSKDAKQQVLFHELITRTHSHYYYTDQRLFIAATQPLIRVAPSVPMRYKSGNWDFGWMIARTDGMVLKLIYDPYTLSYRRAAEKHPLRWFIR